MPTKYICLKKKNFQNLVKKVGSINDILETEKIHHSVSPPTTKPTPKGNLETSAKMKKDIDNLEKIMKSTTADFNKTSEELIKVAKKIPAPKPKKIIKKVDIPKIPKPPTLPSGLTKDEIDNHRSKLARDRNNKIQEYHDTKLNEILKLDIPDNKKNDMMDKVQKQIDSLFPPVPPASAYK